MQTFDQALYEHVTAGRVTVADALNVASSPHDFKLLLDAQGRRGTTMADVPEDAGDTPSRPPAARTPDARQLSGPRPKVPAARAAGHRSRPGTSRRGPSKPVPEGGEDVPQPLLHLVK